MLKLTLSGVQKKIRSAPKLVISFAVVALFTALLFTSLAAQHRKIETITINGARLNVERAESNEEKRRGLCCRESLNSDAGMLFLYDEPGFYEFWMKDTYIPLDIIWISEQKRVVYIENIVTPASYPTRFSSPLPAQYVLEVNAGWAEANHIQLGDTVSF